MARAKRLIVGLGNPGPEYAGTRHNVGFAVADAVAEKAGIALDSGSGSAGFLRRLAGASSGLYGLGWGRIRGYEFGVAKPTTYMNRSGSAVLKLLQKYQLAPKDLLVVTDDINLEPGVVRIRARGSAGGHNGLQDIVDELDTDEFPRLRIGVGSAFPRGQQAKYVLSPFTEEERPLIEEAVLHARDAALAFVTEGLTVAMNRFNRR